MKSPLQHQVPNKEDKKEKYQEESYHSYQAYQKNNTKLKELVFFARIALFSLLTVISAFVLLAFGVSVNLAFPVALLISLALTSICYQTVIYILSD